MKSTIEYYGCKLLLQALRPFAIAGNLFAPMAARYDSFMDRRRSAASRP